MPRWQIAVLFAAGTCLSGSASADPDYDDCKDVFVARLAGFHIQACTEKKFDGYTFAEGGPKETRIEGRIVDTFYQLDSGRREPSPSVVRSDLESALKQSGWTLLYGDTDTLTAVQANAGQERWLQLMSNVGHFYELVAATKAATEQSVRTAAAMLDALGKSGRVALQIHFDIGMATIRPESQALVAQVVSLLQGNPSLSLSVEGFTDNAGDPKVDQKLSEARAQAVVAELVAKGIPASRLTASGFGQERPVADNSTEEGRATNRRIELVKR